MAGFYVNDIYWEALEDASHKMQNEAFGAMVRYYFTGEEPELSGAAKTAFLLVRDRIDAAKAHAEAGKAGGRPKNQTENQTANQNWNQTQNQTQNQTENQTANQNETKPKKNITESKTFLKNNPPIVPPKKEESGEFGEIIDYLNAKTGKRFRCGKNARRHISARLAEGFTLDDFKAVIDDRCSRWLGDAKMEEYLRPETLFGTKFEGYLNSKPKSDGVSNGGWLPKAASW